MELESRWDVAGGFGAAESWRREGHKQRCWRGEAKGWGICLGRKQCFTRHTAYSCQGVHGHSENETGS